MENININTEPTTKYEFDFDKIKTVEDAIRVLKALRISFGNQYPAYEEVKDLLKEVK
jgi:hypothetical protein